jgi:hypothetical protein
MAVSARIQPGAVPVRDRPATPVRILTDLAGGAKGVGLIGVCGFGMIGRSRLPRDRNETARLYRLAAAQGHAPAREALRRLGVQQ